MAAAAAPYVSWMRTAAEQAEQTGNQAISAAAAYEAAFAETVPPPVVAGQPQPAGRAGGHQLLRTEHVGDRDHRRAVRRDVGPGHRRHAELRGCGGVGHPAGTIQFATVEHQPSGPADQAAAVSAAANTSAGDAQGAVSIDSADLLRGPQRADESGEPGPGVPGVCGANLLGLLADLSAVFVDPGSLGSGTCCRLNPGNHGSSVRHRWLLHRYSHRRHRQRLGRHTDLAGLARRYRRRHFR